jgi:ATP-binding cassette subfamily B protein
VLLPEIAFALCLGVGIVLRRPGSSVAELVAFFAMATVLRWPMESIGFLFSFLLDARTASDRIFEVFDEQNTITDPADPVTLGSSRGALAFEGCTSATRMRTPPSATCSTASISPSSRGDDGARGTHRIGQDDPHDAARAPVRRHRGRVTIDGVDVRDLTLHELRTHVGMAFEDSTLFSQTVRENVLLGREDLAPGPPRPSACCVKRSPSRRPASSTSFPTASTRSSAKRACRSPAASASASRSRAPSRRDPPCSCSTTRCRRSTSTPRRSSKTRCAR